MENQTKELYYTKRVFKSISQRPIIVEENLTEEEAQQRVEEDTSSNPDSHYYMLVYSKMKQN